MSASFTTSSSSVDTSLDHRWSMLQDSIQRVAAEFATDRAERQRRRSLEQHDFARLREAGYLDMSLPVDRGGLWEDRQRSARAMCNVVRTLAGGDSSVALVAAMHPSVLSAWLANPRAPSEDDAWQTQREMIFNTVERGAWWGTITSEPGTGGDPGKTRAVALQRDGGYRLSGTKHFGSGSGIASFMITTAIPEGETTPATFMLDLRGRPWDGSSGVKLLSEWDGQGMTATQSHSMRFDCLPVIRQAWPGTRESLEAGTGGLGTLLFTSVIVGIVQAAFQNARSHLGRRAMSLRAYERVEWSQATQDEWLTMQAYEGMISAIECKSRPSRDILQGKVAIAQLAEAALTRLSRVIGGNSFSRQSPISFWFEDVRALGFLRPPWGFAFDRLFDGSLEDHAPDVRAVRNVS